jgi:hypothetical protein
MNAHADTEITMTGLKIWNAHGQHGLHTVHRLSIKPGVRSCSDMGTSDDQVR